MALKLGQRNLALLVADDNVVDRYVTDQPGSALLLLGQQRFNPCRRAFGDEDHARPAYHPVYGVEVTGDRHALGHPPFAAQVVQRPPGCAGLTLRLAIDRFLGPAAEDEEGDQQAQDNPQHDEHVLGETADQDADCHRGGHDRQECADHVRQQAFVLGALHLKRLPQLGAALF